VLESEREIYREQRAARASRRRSSIASSRGQVERFYKDVCLLEQPFIKQSDRTVEEIVKEAIVRFGVNVAVRRFARFALGETAAKENAAGGASGS
jgi:elongation factor Ts